VRLIEDLERAVYGCVRSGDRVQRILEVKCDGSESCKHIRTRTTPVAR
jgi:hypothetical protein